ncbi:MAG: glycosyltransferase, partial [Pseudomonadota bacterium]
LWTAYGRYAELAQLPNLSIIKCDYDDFPAQYEKMDVYISLSELEGGPIPVIEALMSNVIPVVSKTGFAEDILDHGTTGYLFDIDAPVERIAELIDQAYQNDVQVSEYGQRFSWANFGRTIASRIERDVPPTSWNHVTRSEGATLIFTLDDGTAPADLFASIENGLQSVSSECELVVLDASAEPELHERLSEYSTRAFVRYVPIRHGTEFAPPTFKYRRRRVVNLAAGNLERTLRIDEWEDEGHPTCTIS